MLIVLVENAENWSGACYELMILAKNLVKLNHNVIVVSKTNTNVTKKFKKENLNLFECKISNDSDLFAFIRLYRFMKHTKPDIVEIYNQKAYWIVSIICKMLKTKCIINRNVLSENRNKRLFSFLFNRLVDKVVAVSEAVKKHLVTYFGCNEDKIKVIYPAKIISEYENNKESTLRKELNMCENAFLYCYLGRLSSEKSLENLINAFSIVNNTYRNTKLIIVGEGNSNYVSFLSNEIKKTNLDKNIIMLGFRSDVFNIFNGCDVIVNPSSMESFSLSNIEAMLCEKPLISTDCGGIDYIVDGENGFLVQPNSIDELRKKMIYVFENKHILKVVSEKAKQTVINRFTVKRMVEQYLHLYDDILNKRK